MTVGRWTPAEHDRAIAMAAAGQTSVQIGAAIGRSSQSVRAHAIRFHDWPKPHGSGRRRELMPAEDVAAIRNLRAIGTSYTEIVERVGYCPEVVARECKRLGLGRRLGRVTS